MSVVGLERALHQYTLEPSEVPFDIKTVPLATQPLVEQKGHLLTTSTHLYSGTLVSLHSGSPDDGRSLKTTSVVFFSSIFLNIFYKHIFHPEVVTQCS